MIVMLKNPDAENAKTFPYVFSHIECDECFTRAPDWRETGKSLFEHQWFIDGGKHRCPEHYDVDAPARKPDRRST